MVSRRRTWGRLVLLLHSRRCVRGSNAGGTRNGGSTQVSISIWIIGAPSLAAGRSTQSPGGALSSGSVCPLLLLLITAIVARLSPPVAWRRLILLTHGARGWRCLGSGHTPIAVLRLAIWQSLRVAMMVSCVHVRRSGLEDRVAAVFRLRVKRGRRVRDAVGEVVKEEMSMAMAMAGQRNAASPAQAVHRLFSGATTGRTCDLVSSVVR